MVSSPSGIIYKKNYSVIEISISRRLEKLFISFANKTSESIVVFIVARLFSSSIAMSKGAGIDNEFR